MLSATLGYLDCRFGVAFGNLFLGVPFTFDDDLRLRLYRAIYGDPVLQKYAIDPQKPIRIVVDNGHVTLYGVVNNQGDKNIAGIRANQVSGVFSVDNQLLALDQGKK